MLAGGPSAAEFFLTSAAAAAVSTAATGTASSALPSSPSVSTTWRTGKRQPTVVEKPSLEMPFYLKIMRSSAKGAKPVAVYSTHLDGYNHAGWATREAAEAAKPAFKEWAESGRRTAPHAASTAARSSTPSTTEPSAAASRHSNSQQDQCCVCACCRLAACALVTGAAATSTIEWVPMGPEELEAAWRKRSEYNFETVFK